MKKLGILTIVAVMLLSLVSMPALAEGDKIQVVIWHTFTEGQEACLQEIADAFNAEYEDIEVVVQSQSKGYENEKLPNAVVAGTGPNLIIHYASKAAEFIDVNNPDNTKLIDFSEYVYDDEIGIEGFDESIPEKVLAECTSYEDGLMHTIPVYISGPCFYYNQAIYDDLGLKAPTTWEELAENCRAIKESGKYPNVASGFGADSLADLAHMLILQNGSEYMDLENQTVLINNEKAAEAITWFADGVKEGIFALTPTMGGYFSDDFNPALNASFSGSCASGPYLDIEYGVAPLPATGAESWYAGWYRSAMGFTKSPEEDEATYEFIKFFTQPENSAKFCMAVGSISPYAGAMDVEGYPEYVANDRGLAAVQANLQYAGSLPITKVSNTVRTELERAMTRVAVGECTAEVALQEAADYCNREWAAE